MWQSFTVLYLCITIYLTQGVHSQSQVLPHINNAIFQHTDKLPIARGIASVLDPSISASSKEVPRDSIASIPAAPVTNQITKPEFAVVGQGQPATEDDRTVAIRAEESAPHGYPIEGSPTDTLPNRLEIRQLIGPVDATLVGPIVPSVVPVVTDLVNTVIAPAVTQAPILPPGIPETPINLPPVAPVFQPGNNPVAPPILPSVDPDDIPEILESIIQTDLAPEVETALEALASLILPQLTSFIIQNPVLTQIPPLVPLPSAQPQQPTVVVPGLTSAVVPGPTELPTDLSSGVLVIGPSGDLSVFQPTPSAVVTSAPLAPSQPVVTEPPATIGTDVVSTPVIIGTDGLTTPVPSATDGIPTTLVIDTNTAPLPVPSATDQSLLPVTTVIGTDGIPTPIPVTSDASGVIGTSTIVDSSLGTVVPTASDLTLSSDLTEQASSTAALSDSTSTITSDPSTITTETATSIATSGTAETSSTSQLPIPTNPSGAPPATSSPTDGAAAGAAGGNGSSTDLSTGAIAGIAAGAGTIALVAIVGGAILARRYYAKKAAAAAPANYPEIAYLYDVQPPAGGVAPSTLATGTSATASRDISPARRPSERGIYETNTLLSTGASPPQSPDSPSAPNFPPAGSYAATAAAARGVPSNSTQRTSRYLSPSPDGSTGSSNETLQGPFRYNRPLSNDTADGSIHIESAQSVTMSAAHTPREIDPRSAGGMGVPMLPHFAQHAHADDSYAIGVDSQGMQRPYSMAVSTVSGPSRGPSGKSRVSDLTGYGGFSEGPYGRGPP